MSDFAETSLTTSHTFSVGQIKEWGEILTGFETRNKYAVRDQTGQPIWLAVEQSGGIVATILRLWLKAYRPFTLDLMDPQGNALMTLKRPFRFIFHRMEIYDANENRLGAIEKKWSWVRRLYVIEDGRENEIYSLFGPLLKPWTFFIQKGENPLGKIAKKWSGLGKEVFTDADNFSVELDPTLSVEHRKILLASVFLIDFVHFENKSR